MGDPQTLLFVLGLLMIHTCLTEHVEKTTKHGYKTDLGNKKVSKREYYAPEYNHEKYSYPAYRYEYGVHDPQSGDIKKQYEERDGDTVRGYYSLMEPDGSIRLVEYTADSKNGFQAVVKKFGNTQHPTVTYHMNTAGDKGDEAGGGYAPSYQSGELQQYHDGGAGSDGPAASNYGHPHRPAAGFGDHQPHVILHQYNEPHPAHGFAGDDRYQHGPPPAYDHYLQHGPPVAPAYDRLHYEPVPVAPAYDRLHYEPVPVAPAYDRLHYEPVPVAPAYDRLNYGPTSPPPPPLFAAGLPTANGDYGSASPEEYYRPTPLQFPVASAENGFWHAVKDGGGDDDDDDGVHRVGVADEYRSSSPSSDDSQEQVQEYDGAGDDKAGERPEYLRKYFEPDYRGRSAAAADHDVANEDDDESK